MPCLGIYSLALVKIKQNLYKSALYIKKALKKLDGLREN
jgi:hypothetical protein